MKRCQCTAAHAARQIVLTGGPGAGKTATLEMLRQTCCGHVSILPEAAGILFGGGFPRHTDVHSRCAAQRAIYHVQRELEAAVAHTQPALVLCDRGTVDGHAYWPGADDIWSQLGTSHGAELSRYSAVIHLRTPRSEGVYNRQNPLRIESIAEALELDERIEAAWEAHPRRFIVDEADDFSSKIHRVLELVNSEIPGCCSLADAQ